MQHVNDDMDDVFKKAGEAYPLRTGMPNWDKVQQALNAQKEPEPTPKKSNTKYLWLLCLLPVLFICNRWIGTGHNSASEIRATTKKENDETARQSVTTQNQNTTASKPLSRIKPNIVVSNTTAIRPNNMAHQQNQSNKTEARNRTFLVGPDRKNDLVKEIGDLRISNGSSKAENTPIAQRTALAISRQTASFIQTSGAPSRSILPDSIGRFLAADPVLHPKVDATIRSKSTLLYKKGFYAGIMGSADRTSVQLQKTANMGWQGGILAGFAFHKRWSLEAGMFAGRKFYYTKGEYFDKSRTYLAPNSEITDVWGSCTMLEFPLAIKYNIRPGEKAHFFATAGISSYVMKRENYAYKYLYRGSGNYAMHEKSYRNATTDLLSVLQLSGGYAHGLSRSVSLRVEPFVKLPIAGLGYGRLHFASAGVSAGVIKNFSPQ
jgi:hypothetical protein